MCSYCGCSSIEVIGRFMAEHDELVNRMGVLRRAIATGDQLAVRAEVVHLQGLLDPHTHAEEVGIFAVLREDEEFTGAVDRLCGEHLTLDEQLDRIAAGETDLMPTFERALRAHIDHEDNGLFPASAIRLAGPEWDRVHDLTPHAHESGEHVH